MRVRRFVLELSEETFEKIRDIASNERRSVKDQAAVMLERAVDEERDCQPAPAA